MWLPVLVGLALAGPDAETDPATLPQPGIGALPPEVLGVASAVRDRPLPERMAAISEVLLGRPYVNDPMGEGGGHDPDPFARYDAFDCLTYAEEVLALSLAGDPAHAAAVRDDLRYDGEPSYAHRRHFMELQWVPAAVERGWLVDTTATLGPVRHLEKVVDQATWDAWGPRSRFPIDDEAMPSGTMALDVLTLDDALAAVDRIPPGSLVLTVREDRVGVPIWTTHVGFVVPTDDGLRLRHATKLGSGGTRDQSLAWYLDHIRSYRWKVAGITVLTPIEAGPRRSRLPPGTEG